jgi:hypothetical protein
MIVVWQTFRFNTFAERWRTPDHLDQVHQPFIHLRKLANTLGAVVAVSPFAAMRGHAAAEFAALR